MRLRPPYTQVKEAIEAEGYFTSLQPLSDDKRHKKRAKLVCATSGGDWGIGGISFWITWETGKWFLATWAPRYYELPAETDVVEVVTAALRAAGSDPSREYHDIPAVVKIAFTLKEVPYERFYGGIETEDLD